MVHVRSLRALTMELCACVSMCVCVNLECLQIVCLEKIYKCFTGEYVGGDKGVSDIPTMFPADITNSARGEENSLWNTCKGNKYAYC
ncbi:unnamed protein product [Brugia pahangi]|uniref:Secreted protein n=1 Tax=Brugia pahangi TaxID=6280 RepID=A0A0N4SYF5_BRUPA|nr:unnamed protein product [Brugia pahangi]